MQNKPATLEQASLIARVISVLVLVALVVLFGVMFYQVMAEFLMPIFLAILMAVLFQPLFNWLLPRCRNSHNLTALVTVGIVLLSILIPIFWLSLQGIREAQSLIKIHTKNQVAVTEQQNVTELQIDPALLTNTQTKIADLVTYVNEHFKTSFEAAPIQNWLQEQTLIWIKWLAFKTPEAVIGFLFGMTIMLLSLYYFLIDGQKMINSMGRLLPLEAEHQQRLFRDFASVSRAVATATILAALCQGLLAGVGYWLAGVPSTALLTMLTVLAALIPFIGAAIIWIPCCLWLAFFQVDGTWPAIFLAIYGVAIVSTVDNFIKPLILQGQTNLHPLLALLSVLGGVNALGPVGIFVGPMTVVFLQAALSMLQSEIQPTKPTAKTG